MNVRGVDRLGRPSPTFVVFVLFMAFAVSSSVPVSNPC
jgi:hypothetical protein